MTTNQNFNLLGEGARPLTEHPGLRRAYRSDGMTLGIIAPLEGFAGPVPTMADQSALVALMEDAGFAQYWVRDVPLLDPNFGDTGQVFDTFTYLGYLAATTDRIALGTASSVLPLRQPLDIAKAAASVDQLSGGRFTLGVASGDRAVEFPAYGRRHDQRGELFRESLAYLRAALENRFPTVRSPFGQLQGADLLPKPTHERLPLFITGTSRQTVEWIADNGDGWLFYTLPPEQQEHNIKRWRRLTAAKGEPGWKPFNQATYFDLAEDPRQAPTPIHQGFRVGREPLIDLLHRWESIGIDQLMINLKQSTRPAREVLAEFGEYIVPLFPAGLSPVAAH
ncbi:LLM class oxidoreductase [Granulicoccus phenolivorans]|uniref:LLM class oxidoreductase n=1 Tax=Granulicoccus phenolivorans TaxID=266854 RepID=UPI000419D580|nr:LLM class oxidoreductase [Granulicoccus phenolivorans]